MNKDFEPTPIPYALAIALEVGTNVREDIRTTQRPRCDAPH